jgi:SulP family sulfate permease
MTTEPDDTESLPTSDLGPLVNLPGVRELREVVANARRRAPSRATLRQDGLAGLTVAIASVPDGMAGGLLAGVNPVYGLYASMVGPVVGGLLASTRLMVITNTSAASLVAGQALAGGSPGQRDDNLFLMVVLSGGLAIAFGLLGLGRITRFVSYSVMTGFLTGIAVLLILSQLPVAVGYEVQGANRITQTLDLLRRLDEVSVMSLALAGLTAVLAVLLQRTPLRPFGSLLAISVPTVLVVLFDLAGVQVVRDVGAIPRGVPMPALPAFADALDVLTGALSLAVIVLVQGAGVSQIVPNADGSRSRASRDFIAQGAANVAAGFFRGLPVGGSLGATALNVASGARRRWAAILAGLWMAVIVLGLPGLVAQVAMPALAALLVLAGMQSIKPGDVVSVWRAGWPSRLAGLVTFVATLVLPIQVAVGLGVALSTLLYVNKASTDISVVELVQRPDGWLEEREPPQHLPADRVTVLDIYGHVFYAGARTLERLLPPPEKGAEHPVVVLRLRGRTSLGATLEEVLSRYAEKLAAVGGRLYLTGLGERAHHEVVAMAKLHLSGPVRAYEVTPILGESTHAARADAEAWLVGLKQGT